MNDLDTLMSRIDEINAKSADELSSDDIDTIIAYHRRQRQRKASGEKPTKPKVDLSGIMKSLKASGPQPEPIKRRI